MNRNLLVITLVVLTVAVASAIAFGIARLLAPDAPAVTQIDPQIMGIAPAAAPSGTPRVPATVTGEGFQVGAYVRISRAGQPDLKITGFVASTPATLTDGILDLTDAEPGSWDVVVTNPDGTQGSCTGCFAVTGSPTTPTIDALSTTTASQDSSVELIISGTRFEEGATVTLSGMGIAIGGTVRRDAATLVTQVTVSSEAPVGVRSVTVTNPSLGSAVCTDCFTVTAGAPEATSVSPSTHGAGARNRQVEISGARFTAGATLSFPGGGITATGTAVTSAGTIATTLSFTSSTAVGARDVVISNPDGRRTTCAGCLSVSAAPVAQSIQPDTVVIGSSTTILVNGTNFQRDTVLALGAGLTVEDLAFVDATRISARVSAAPSALAGMRVITLTSPDGGTSATPGLFTVVRPPVVAPTSTVPVATSTPSTTL